MAASDEPLQATRVGSEEEERTLELIDVYVADVLPAHAQALSRVLSRHVRQPELSHLKRIRSDRGDALSSAARASSAGRGGGEGSERAPAEAVASLAADQCDTPATARTGASAQARLVALICSAEAPPDQLGEEVCAALLPFALQPRLARVPRFPPAARWQYEAWLPIWPLSCPAHVSTAAQRDLAEPELASLAVHMRTALRAAAAAAARDGAEGVGIVIVAPDGLTELAVGTHTIWPPGRDPPSAHRAAHPLQHAAMRAIGAVAAGNVRARDGDSARTGERDRGAPAADGAHPAGHYLCSGCTAVLTVEPCAMCAMALLHSRIGRVVYAAADPGSGALGSRYRLHTHRQLNHRFEVHRGLCAQEAGRGVAASCLLHGSE